MKKSLFAVGATAAALLILLSACALPVVTEPTDEPTGAGDFVACMVSDQGGFDDKSFNQTSFAGVTKAVADFGIKEKHVQSIAATDYANNVNSMVEAGCNVIIGVGFALSDAIVAAASANPEIAFAVVDDSPGDAPSNVKAIVFNTNESSFLAGYLAASLSESGLVGTYGGQPYPSVTIFMDGYAQGVDYYNEQKGASVKVLGWNVETQQGTFVQSENPFVDVAAGKTAAQNQVAQGVDVLFPVAGNAGTGAMQVSQESNGKIATIWVDTDGCISAADYCPVLATSVYKAMDVAVYQVIKDAMDGNFSSAPYVGTLANEGTGIAPYHDWDSKISADTKAEIEAIKAKIISGEIKVASAGAH